MSLALIYTGGTIGGRRGGRGPVTGDHDTASFARLLKRRLPPEAVFDAVEGVLGQLSENLQPADWAKLARAIDARIRGGAAGIVVAHGTDTLVYTACALRWLLGEVPVPVVMTGSRLPLEDSGTDAVRNLVHARSVARQIRRPGVWISFSGTPDASSRVLDPRNACKIAGRADCFHPVWGRAAGAVASSSGRVTWARPASSARKACPPRFDVNPAAVLFTMYPGFQPDWIRRAAEQGARGIVLAGYGSGTACVTGPGDLRPAVRAAAARGAAVWMVSQHGGRVEAAYGSTAALVKAGVRLMPGWTPEAALTALMCRLDDDLPAGYREVE